MHNLPEKKYMVFKRTLTAFIILLVAFVSFYSGQYLAEQKNIVIIPTDDEMYSGNLLGKYSEAKPGRLTEDIDFELFWDTWDVITEDYVDKEHLEEKKIFYGALRGMVAAVGDPYTVFMNPKVAQEFSNDLAGTFEGIGAEIGIKNEVVTVVSPLPDMPAEKAGLLAGDKILAINGTSTAGMSIDQAVNLIRGPKDTAVILTITRNGFESAEDISITRGKIIVKSVRKELRDDGIYVIKVTNFNDDTLNLFNEAVREIIKANPKGLILDLRGNPGGYLDTAIEMASEWIEDGPVVVEKFSDDRKQDHLARNRARLKTFPTIVLVNGGSASASEIVSGALQDYGLATIIGKKTFGKGSVQSLNQLDDGSSIKLTVAKWLTPEGRSINDEGIEPDYDIDLTFEDYNANLDPQLDAAIDFLNDEFDMEKYVKATSTEETGEEVVE